MEVLSELRRDVGRQRQAGRWRVPGVGQAGETQAHANCLCTVMPSVFWRLATIRKVRARVQVLVPYLWDVRAVTADISRYLPTYLPDCLPTPKCGAGAVFCT